MTFDLQAARDAGASDQQIAQFLAEKSNFDLDSALQSGSNPTQIAEFLAPKVGQAKKRARGRRGIGGGRGVSGTDVLESVGRGLTLGNLPTVQGAVQPGFDTVANLVTGNQAEPRGFSEARDLAEARQAEFARENQGISLVGELAGGLVSGIPLASAGAFARGGNVIANLLRGGAGTQRVAQAGLTGGTIGGLQDPGEGSRLENVATGAVTGGALQGGSEAVSRVGKKLAEEVAPNLAFRSLGAFKRQAKNILGSDKRRVDDKRLNELGRVAIKEGLIKKGRVVGADPEEIALRTANKLDELGPQIGEIIENTSNKLADPNFLEKLTPAKRKLLDRVSINPQKISSEFLSKLKKDLRGTAGAKRSIDKAEDALSDLLELGDDATIQDINNFRITLDKIVPFDGTENQKIAQDVVFRLRGFLQGKVQKNIDALGRVVGTDDIKQLKSLNKRFSDLSDINKVARERALANQANNLFSLRDTIVGSAAGLPSVAGELERGDIEGALQKGLIFGLGGATLSNFGRNRGLSTAAQGTNRIGELLQKANQAPQLTGVVGGL